MSSSPSQSPPGRPRDPQVEHAILAAARELVVERGYGSVTLGAIAERAGVGRPTVYRRWKGKAEVVFDALFEATETVEFSETGDLEVDLRAVGRVVGNDMASPAAAQALIALMAEVGDDGELSARIREETIKPRTAGIAEIVRRAQERGAARASVDPVMALHAIAGILYYHAAVLGERVDDDLADRVVDLVLYGVAAHGERGARMETT